jgi:hypothetical protein
MKKQILFSSKLFAGIFILFLAACQPEETPKPERDKFIGSWTCAESSTVNGSSSFTVHITESSAKDTEVYIENFYNYGSDTDNVTATLTKQ